MRRSKWYQSLCSIWCKQYVTLVMDQNNWTSLKWCFNILIWGVIEILSYNSFIFDCITSTFTWSFYASKIIFDISCVISSTFKAILVKLWPGPTCMYACIICKSLSLNNLIFFHILVHFCIFWVFVPPHNTLEMLKFYFGFQLLKFFLELNEPPLPSYVICIWIRLIK